MTFLTPSIIRLKINGATTEFDSTSTVSTGGILTLSDHSRSQLSVNYEVIEKSNRMADGTMRRYIVSKKRKFSCQWSMLPTIRGQVADGNADARDMKEFYDKYCYSELQMSLFYMQNATERGKPTSNYNRTLDANHYIETPINVFWSGFNFDVAKRLRNFDYWNVSAEFTEI